MRPQKPGPDRIDEEIAFHIEQQTAKHLRAGMNAEDARRAARIKFGAIEGLREGARDEVRGAWLRDIARDLRISFRSLRRMPSFSAATILTLGLGLGAAVAMFSVVNAVLLRPLPYPDSDGIVRLFQVSERGNRSNVSGPNFFDWRDGTKSFSHMALMSNWWGRAPITGLGEPRRVPSLRISREFFDVFGVGPARGRLFTAEEYATQQPTAAVVAAGFADRVGGPDALGKTFVLDGHTITVIGIMPREFDYPVGTEMWLPLSEEWANTTSRTAGNFNAIARLARGARLEAARAEISGVSRGLRARLGEGAVLVDAQIMPILELMTLTTRASLNMLLAGAFLLLVVAVVNVSNMLVARAVQRRKEFAVQLALGAGTSRLTRQLLAEALALCLCGAVVGIGLAAAALRAFVAIGPPGTPRLDTVAIDWASASAGVTLAVVAAGMLAWITAMGARSRTAASALSDESRSGSAGRRQTRLRQGLIVVEVAITFVLVAGAGLLARSLASVLAIDPGFRTDNALIVDITMGTQTDEELVQRARRQADIVRRLEELPGVEHVGLIDSFPVGNGAFRNGTFLEMTRADEFTNGSQIQELGSALGPRRGSAGYRLTNGGYFKAMGIPLRRGRLLEDGDAPGAPHVAVISESLAIAKWPGQDPIGRYIQFGNMDGDYTGLRIVGIVGDVRELSIERAAPSIVYASFVQRPRQAAAAAIVVRGPEPAIIADTVRRAIRELAPEVPVELRTSDGVLDAATGARRFNLWLIGAFGTVALLLAGVGVYGLIAFTVAQRRREMGIRLALGAHAGAMVRLIVRNGLALVIMGLVAGLGLTLAVSRFIETLLFGVTPSDPAVLISAGAVTLAAAAAATYLPARRAAAIAPIESLRSP